MLKKSLKKFQFCVMILLLSSNFLNAKGILEDEFKDLEVGGEVLYRYDKQKTNSKALKREKKPKLKGTLDLMLPLNSD